MKSLTTASLQEIFREKKNRKETLLGSFVSSPGCKSKSDALDQSEGIGPWQSRCSHVDSFDTSVLQCSYEGISSILKVTLENKLSIGMDPHGCKDTTMSHQNKV